MDWAYIVLVPQSVNKQPLTAYKIPYSYITLKIRYVDS